MVISILFLKYYDFTSPWPWNSKAKD